MTFSTRCKIANFKNQIDEDRVWISGCGPTLDDHDLSLIEDELIFCLNASICLFQNHPGAWWFFRDSRILLECQPKLVEGGWNPWQVVTTSKGISRVEARKLDRKKINCRFMEYHEGNVQHKRTVLEDALQVLDMLGFRECYLIGIDHALRNCRPYAESLMWKECHFYNLRIMKERKLPVKPVSGPLTRMAKVMKELVPQLKMKVFNVSTIYPLEGVFEMVDYEETARNLADRPD